ncbi:MAG: glycosyltransferase family 2 protein [Pseudomonadales bacterium]
MTSIIIPAHNEENVIRATLTTLLAGLDLVDTEVLVVCNGCSDATAAEAGSIGGPVQVIEIDQASKIEALNVGDAMARSYPRLYLDADVEIDGTSISRLVEELQRPGATAAEPVPRIDTSQSSLPVKAYYAVSVALHGQRPGDLGCGIYAMSHDGRARFGAFPDVIADDAYARGHFDSGELVRVNTATSVIYAPERVEDLLQIKTRSRLGTLELQEKYPELWARKQAHMKPLIDKAAALPIRVWPAVPIYVALQLLARRRARKLTTSLDSYRWQRDESSRDRPDDAVFGRFAVGRRRTS